MARVMAPYKFDATIVFMTVPGEEQGLLGSTYFAEQAKKDNLDIEGMFTNDIIGSSYNEEGKRDNKQVRLFAEGTWQAAQEDVVIELTSGQRERLVFKRSGRQLVAREWDRAFWGEGGPGVLYPVR